MCTPLANGRSPLDALRLMTASVGLSWRRRKAVELILAEVQRYDVLKKEIIEAHAPKGEEGGPLHRPVPGVPGSAEVYSAPGDEGYAACMAALAELGKIQAGDPATGLDIEKFSLDQFHGELSDFDLEALAPLLA